jgi:hypothetical protein
MDREILNCIALGFLVIPLSAICVLMLVWTYGVLD